MDDVTGDYAPRTTGNRVTVAERAGPAMRPAVAGGGFQVARRMSSPIMVGRGSESRAFAAALQDARHGRTSVLIIGGEAGVGKTRLVAEFAADARADGGTAVVGAAPPPAGGRPTPFAALTPVLRGLVRSIDARLVDSMLGSARDDLAALLPELGSRPPRIEEPEPFAAARLAESVLVAIEVVARLRPPVMIAIEDVHWADDATRAIVSYACRTLVDAKVVVVVTYRSDAVHEAAMTLEFIAELTRLPGAEHVELGPLSADDVNQQVRAILGSDPEAELIRALVRRSDGNPFFVEELVAAIIDGGVDRPPPSVRTMVASRMASVSEASRTIVEIAAIADPDVPAELLALTARMKPAAFDVAVREAWDANLLVRSSVAVDDAAPGAIERLDLRHVLVREVILSSLSAPRRQELHARLADAIEARPATAGDSALERNARLASHLLMARQLERAVPPLLREAAAAEEVRAFVIADQAYRRALDAMSQLGVDAAVRQDLATTLERAALAASLAGDPLRAVGLAQDALAVGPDAPERTVRLRLHLGGYLAEAGMHDRALATLLEAVHGAPPRTILQVRCGTALARELIVHGRFEDAAREARTKAEEAGRLRARTEEVAARAVEASALARLGRLAHALAALQLSPPGAIDRGSSRSRSRSRPSRFGAAMQSYLDRANVLEQAGDASAAARLALDGRDEAARRGLSDTMGVVMAAVAAHDLLRSGGWDEAADLLADVAPVSRQRRQAGSAMVALVRAELACLRGEWDLAEDSLAEARTDAPDVGQPGWVSLSDLVSAEVACWRRHYGDARAAVMRATVLAENDGDRLGVARLACVGIRIEADATAASTRRTGRDTVPSDEIAIGHWVRLQAAGGGVDGAGTSQRSRALVSTGAAELGRLGSDLGMGHVGVGAGTWDAAVAAWEQAGDPYSEAYARFRRAEATLAHGGDRAWAEADLRAALSVADRLGAVPLGREIEQLARRARLAGVRDGSESDRSAEPGYAEARRYGLSNREIEVLTLLAAGLPDREIAERLFITTKTTGHHVSHVLAKLGVDRRGEAAAVAYRIGLMPAPGQ